MFLYQKLDIYQISKDIVLETYKLTREMPASEQFGLISQMNRAAISIPSNIAEGSGRLTDKGKLQFISIAYSSLMELTCQAEIALALDLIEDDQYSQFIVKCKDLAIRLSNFRKKLNSANNSGAIAEQ